VNFFVKTTKNVNETLEYLIRITNKLVKKYEGNKIENPISFQEYCTNNSKSKELTIKEIFAKQLMAVFIT